MVSRLDFVLPEFLRTMWTSAHAREYWEPKIHAISNAWQFVERASVTQTLRPGALQSVAPELLPELQNWLLKNELEMSIVGMEGAHESYGNASISYVPGAPFTYRVYFGSNPKDFLASWKEGDNLGIGELLGFPQCCTEFFEKYWKNEEWRDLTIPAMDESETRNLIYNNVLLRHLGVRPIFHLPCSFTCKFSCQIGIQNHDLMSSLGYEKEAQWMIELLSMPMEWSSLHGIAILVTPIFKLIYNSDPLAKRATLNLISDHYPEHGASGKNFPFLNTRPAKMKLYKKERFNGFSTPEGMREGHAFILASLPLDITGVVLDLGCGTGELLKAIVNKYPDTAGYGVDSDSEVLDKAVEPGHYDHSDIFLWDWDTDFDLVLIAIQRLFEVDKDKAFDLLENIFWHTRRLLVYSYDGWFNGLDDLLSLKFQVVSTNRDAIMNYEAKLFERKITGLSKL